MKIVVEKMTDKQIARIENMHNYDFNTGCIQSVALEYNKKDRTHSIQFMTAGNPNMSDVLEYMKELKIRRV